MTEKIDALLKGMDTILTHIADQLVPVATSGFSVRSPVPHAPRKDPEAFYIGETEVDEAASLKVEPELIEDTHGVDVKGSINVEVDSAHDGDAGTGPVSLLCQRVSARAAARADTRHARVVTRHIVERAAQRVCQREEQFRQSFLRELSKLADGMRELHHETTLCQERVAKLGHSLGVG